MSEPSDFRILIAEDEPVTRLFLVLTIESFGFDVLQAADGIEACELAYRNSTKTVHLLLSDFHMPRMDGAELVYYLKKSRPELKVIILTGSQSGELPDTLQAQVEHMLQKPVRAETLRQHIHDLLLVG